MTEASAEFQAGPLRSSFVTVVAWIFIALSAFTSLVGVLQVIMLQFMPMQKLDAVMADTTMPGHMPAAARTVFQYMPLLAAVGLIMSLAMLVAAIGLLRRQNWARLMFIGVLSVGIVYGIAGFLLQQSMLSSFPTSFGTVPTQDSTFQHTAAQMHSMVTVMRVVMGLFAVAVTALFGWIIARLLSPRIRAEFGPKGHAA